MTRFLLLALLLSLVFVVKLFEWNPGSVTFQYLPGHAVEIPEVALFVLSLGLGAGFVMIVHGTGDFLRWLRNLDEAREEKREEKVTALWKKVREELNRSHVPQAISLLERLVSLYPNHLEALLLLGNLRRSTGDATGAIRLHRRARVFDEEDVRLVIALCEDYRQAGRLDDEMAILSEYFHKKKVGTLTSSEDTGIASSPARSGKRRWPSSLPFPVRSEKGKDGTSRFRTLLAFAMKLVASTSITRKRNWQDALSGGR